MSEQEHAATDEFERTPVPSSALKGPGKFWGMYAGEHTAGTEFMIGPLFLAAGASIQDLILGLLLGNVLATLTWRFLVTPIAMKKRLTLYYQLERIAGGGAVKLYNFVNGVLFCFLAGAMVTVSASAVGVPFGVTFSVPESWYQLGSPAFTGIVVVVGAVISAIACQGYETVARVANIAAPWMIIVFAACGLVSYAQMNSGTPFTWQQAIDFVKAENIAAGKDNPDFGFWKIVIFGWLCNGAMHFGMADLSVFRFARDRSSGWAPAIGMFLGHYVAWICAALLLAAQIKLHQDTSANPGMLAWRAIGGTGIICVIIAGWTTANPTIYRAGLAFQGMFPNSKRATMTLLAGVIATIAGAFPTLSAKLLDFVGTYGTILGSMGAVIFVDFWLMKKFHLRSEYAHATGSSFHPAVLIAWLLPVTAGLYLIYAQGVFAAYLVIPCWIVCGLLFLGLSLVTQKKA
ncbi:NCS1 family nucleobase:cation symporter-1 [Haloferula luteola]|uniref:NCS1 family nucleobase:cation symporter-1 n=1 Tax=Haloferula luteola TaxID=595692 RepID=A0A840V6G4_9BACT|nr:hypothetical protein [Haloferula luteola]MBB5353243.1 NCS1 family nucleobase:cation symporter-1 [Haloferula luteola]